MALCVSRRTIFWTSVTSTFVLLVTLCIPLVGWAMPRYAQATGQPCSRCHVDPAGGGPRNAFGQSFEAIPFHSTDPARAYAQLTGAAPAAPAPAAPAPAAPAAPAAQPTAVAPAAPPATLPRTGDPASAMPMILALAGSITLAMGAGLRRGR